MLLLSSFACCRNRCERAPLFNGCRYVVNKSDCAEVCEGSEECFEYELLALGGCWERVYK